MAQIYTQVRRLNGSGKCVLVDFLGARAVVSPVLPESAVQAAVADLTEGHDVEVDGDTVEGSDLMTLLANSTAVSQ